MEVVGGGGGAAAAAGGSWTGEREQGILLVERTLIAYICIEGMY